MRFLGEGSVLPKFNFYSHGLLIGSIFHVIKGNIVRKSEILLAPRSGVVKVSYHWGLGPVWLWLLVTGLGRSGIFPSLESSSFTLCGTLSRGRCRG